MISIISCMRARHRSASHFSWFRAKEECAYAGLCLPQPPQVGQHAIIRLIHANALILDILHFQESSTGYNFDDVSLSSSKMIPSDGRTADILKHFIGADHLRGCHRLRQISLPDYWSAKQWLSLDSGFMSMLRINFQMSAYSSIRILNERF